MNHKAAKTEDQRVCSPTGEGFRVVGVFAHPDDESYWAGGILAWCAQQGARVHVICLTHGELWVAWMASKKNLESTRLPDRLAELRRACQILGVEPPTIFDFGDGQLDRIWHTKVGLLAGVLGDLQPHIVITMGQDGVYGHRDHIACSAMVGSALNSVDQTQSIRLLHSAFPKRLFLPIYRSLQKVDKPSITAEMNADQIGVEDKRIDLKLNLAMLKPIKQQAIRAHTSQQGFFPPAILDWLLQKEHFSLVQGPGFGTLTHDPFLALDLNDGN